MKLTIEPTKEIMKIEGVPCRVWKGTDANGTEVKVWIRTLQPQTDDPKRLADFDRELDALPTLQPAAIDYRFLVD